MVDLKFYEMGRKCVDKFYKDCDFVDVVNANQVSKKDTSKHLTIKRTSYDTVPCSRTTKIVMRDKHACKDCGLKATHAIVMKNHSNNKMALCFVGEYRGEFLPLTKDHIVPKMMGGRDSLRNLQALCQPCNQIKSHKVHAMENDNKGMITISKDEYHRLIKKQSDFASTRELIKSSLKKLPWYLRLLGGRKYINERIKWPVTRLGYFGDNISNREKKNGN